MFSSRVQADRAPNRLAQALEQRPPARPFLDLTETNPTRAGFEYPADLLEPLSSPLGLRYSPEPLGAIKARRAVAADYARRGLLVDPDRIVLTASSSETYSRLFQILCDPGDEVLAPRPSYPLFEHLGRLDAVTIVPYDLEYDQSWRIDPAGAERMLSNRTRALLVVTPNNPTGSYVKAAELDALAAICARRGIAMIADEVFGDYELTPGAARSSARATGVQEALTFSLGGLSKSIGLPQVKLGWAAVAGPARLVDDALSRLELACDTYLSVSTPVQLAAPTLLERGALVRAQIQQRVAVNYNYLVRKGAASPACDVLNAEGGWQAVVRVPSFCPEEDLVLGLLSDADVLVHPGYFFDFPNESYVIVSLLVSEAVFREGVARMFQYLDARGDQM